MRPFPIPAGIPQLPTDLKRHHRFTRASGHGQQIATLALQYGLNSAVDGLNSAVDGDLLVIARDITRHVVIGSQQLIGGILGNPLASPESIEQFAGRWVSGQFGFLPR